MKTLSLIFLTMTLLSSLSSQAATRDSLALAQAGCQDFKAKLKANPRITFGVAEVPLDWNHPDAGTTPVFWWKRAGTDSSYPPIAFLHGGVAGNSWALLDRYQDVLNNYPGDFVSFDHRGEGCSKTLRSNLQPSAYENFRSRSVVRDLEFLRKEVFQFRQWRVMGHSRGSALIHLYLEMAPEALESAHAMGFTFLPKEEMIKYSAIRAKGFSDTANAYLALYPGDRALVQEIRARILPDTCWLGLDDVKICGPAALDVFAGDLSRYSAWPDLHKTLVGMVDFATTFSAVQARLLKDTYGHYNYILGTNGQDFSSANMEVVDSIRTSPIFTDPFLAEVRYVADVVAPAAGVVMAGNVDVPDYAKIKGFLTAHPEFKYFLYAGDVDPIAPPEMFRFEVGLLGSSVNFSLLKNTAHDGWFHPQVLNTLMKKNF